MKYFLKRVLIYWRLLRSCDQYSKLKKGKFINLGPNCEFHPCKYITMGDVSINRDVRITTSSSGKSPIKIGNNVSIAPRVMIIGGNHNFTRTDVPTMLQGEGKQGAIIIEYNVWIGAASIILTGVTIGTGSIIGAGSIVTKSIPKYSIVAGNPARVIKNRLEEF